MTRSPRSSATRASVSCTTGSCWRETLEMSKGRAFVLDRVCTPEMVGPALVGPLRRLFEDTDGTTLAGYLVGGVLKADLHPGRVHSLKWSTLRADDFLLPPLPNHLFQRDNSCWIYGGVSINPMAKPARQRESLHTQGHLPVPPPLRIRQLGRLLRRRRREPSAGLGRGRRCPRPRTSRRAGGHGRADHADGGRDPGPGVVRHATRPTGSSPWRCPSLTP